MASYCVAAENGIANFLARDEVDPSVGLHVDVLAKKANIDSGKLARCLRLLCGECVFVETALVSRSPSQLQRQDRY